MTTTQLRNMVIDDIREAGQFAVGKVSGELWATTGYWVAPADSPGLIDFVDDLQLETWYEPVGRRGQTLKPNAEWAHYPVKLFDLVENRIVSNAADQIVVPVTHEGRPVWHRNTDRRYLHAGEWLSVNRCGDRTVVLPATRVDLIRAWWPDEAGWAGSDFWSSPDANTSDQVCVLRTRAEDCPVAAVMPVTGWQCLGTEAA